MKYQTNELTGWLLDAAVAKAEGMIFKVVDQKVWGDGSGITFVSVSPACRVNHNYFEPSKLWAHGGPIIERERIAIVCSRPRFDTNDGQRWDAYFDGRYTGPDGQVECNGDISEGATALIAAMRSFVTAKLGAETEL